MGALTGGQFSENWAEIESGQEQPVARLPSENPEWFQDIHADLGYSVPIKKVKAAIDKALAGEKLGVGEARYVAAIMDHLSGLRTDPQELEMRKADRDRARELRKTGQPTDLPEFFDEYEDIAGLVYEESEYDPD